MSKPEELNDQEYVLRWKDIRVDNLNDLTTFETFDEVKHYNMYMKLYPFDFQYLEMMPISSLEFGFAYLIDSMENCLRNKCQLSSMIDKNFRHYMKDELTPLHYFEENFIKNFIFTKFFFGCDNQSDNDTIESFENMTSFEIWRSLTKKFSSNIEIHRMAMKSFNRLNVTDELMTESDMKKWVLETDSWYRMIKNNEILFNRNNYKQKIINAFKYKFGSYFKRITTKWEKESVQLDEIFTDVLALQMNERHLFH